MPYREPPCSIAHPSFGADVAAAFGMTDQWADTLRQIEQSTERLRQLIDEAHEFTERLEIERKRRAMLPRVFGIRLDLNQRGLLEKDVQHVA
jgi:hypothetical protein